MRMKRESVFIDFCHGDAENTEENFMLNRFRVLLFLFSVITKMFIPPKRIAEFIKVSKIGKNVKGV